MFHIIQRIRGYRPAIPGRSSVPGVDNLLLTSTTHARYTTTNNNIGTTPPRQIGITLRLDF
jgi:hypothetical protein